MPHRVDATGEKFMAHASPPLTGPRVVVVMDDPLAKVLELVLRHGRYEDRVTTDRAEFSRLLREWIPHIILIDLDLHPTFLELSQTGADKTVPTLVFTRRRETALKLRAFEHGADDIESNAVDSHIRDLRVKLGDTWPSSKFIETIPGKGYRWRHVSPPERPN